MKARPEVNRIQAERLRVLLSERVGYEIPTDFHAFIERQAAKLATDLRLDSVRELADLLELEAVGTPLWVRFVSRMTIGESYLFRNPNHMRMLREAILPYLLTVARSRPVHIWSAGCARGEEPATLAILLNELDTRAAELPIRITATDIDAEALDTARSGAFGQWAFRQTPYHVQRRYFAPRDGKLLLHPAVLGMIEFGYHHVALEQDLPSFPAQGFDLILCRNLLMYLRADYRARAGRLFARRLQQRGLLIPGQVERIDGADDLLSRHFCGGSAVYYPMAALAVVTPLLVACEPKDDASLRKVSDVLGMAAAPQQGQAVRHPTREPGPQAREAPGPGTAGAQGRSVLRTARPQQPIGLGHAVTRESAARWLHDRDESEAPEAVASRQLQSLTTSGLYDSVRSLMATGKVDEAVDHCLALIEADPLDARHHCLLSLVFLDSDNPQAAIESLRRAVYCDPDSLTAFYMWWLIGVRYRATPLERARWARRHLVRLVTELPDDAKVPLFDKVTAGDVRYLLQRDWDAFTG